jgi:glycerol kinase
MPVADPLLLAIDQGTSSTKALLVDSTGAIVAHGSAPLREDHPEPGWVEQSATEIWDSVRGAVTRCLVGMDRARVAGIGLSTQRESLLLWERKSGQPVGPMLSWQDQRTIPECEQLRAAGVAGVVRSVSGLPLDPMFSALKARWLLDTYDADRRRSRRGALCLGTVDAWLLSQMCGDHIVEVGSASRTQLLNVHTREWDPRLLEVFDVPPEVLPRVVGSTGPFPAVRNLSPLPAGTPVAAVMGDSHAALFAHAGWRPGCVKATYGTGSSIMSVAAPAAEPPDGLCLTVAWDAGEPCYALEGNIRASGATLAWLAEFLGTTPDELIAEAAHTSAGVHLVPAFGGLGAPWWDDGAVATISGLTLASRRAHLARAALESIAFQVEDVVDAVERHGVVVETLLADGGPTGNAALMQLQADTSGRRVERALARDLSALGAAHLAGLATGVWGWDELQALHRERESFDPREALDARHRRIDAWRRAVARARHRPDDVPAALIG